MKKVLVLLVVLGFAGVASASITSENWDGWTVTDDISAATGWGDLKLEGNTRTGLTVEAAGINVSNSAGTPVGGTGTIALGAATTIDSSVLGGTSLTVSVMANTSGSGQNLGYLCVGDSSLMTGANSNALCLVGKGGVYRGFTMLTFVDGSRAMDANFSNTTEPPLSGPNPDTFGYFEMKIDMTLNVSGQVTAASASYHDVDDTTGADIGSWYVIADYTGITPFAITHVGLISACNNSTDAPLGLGPDFDNLAVTPEPATLAVLALGGLLGLISRRR